MITDAANVSEPSGRPWGWLAIIALAVAALAIGLHSLGDKTGIDGRWSGPFQIDSVHADHALHRAGEAFISIDAADGFMDRHGGAGAIRFSGDPKAYAFRLFEIEPAIDYDNPRHPMIRTVAGDKVLSGEGEIPPLSPSDPKHFNDPVEDFRGTVGGNAIHLHTRACLDVASPDCKSDYRLSFDLSLAKSDERKVGIWAVAWPFVFLAPIFLVFYKQRYQPWRGVYLVIAFTLLAGLTFWVTWIIALASIALPSELRPRRL